MNREGQPLGSSPQNLMLNTRWLDLYFLPEFQHNFNNKVPDNNTSSIPTQMDSFCVNTQGPILYRTMVNVIKIMCCEPLSNIYT